MSAPMAELSQLLRDRLGPGPALEPETDLVSDLGLDSIAQLELVVALENHFEIVLEPEEGAALRTLGDVAAWVERARRGEAS
jgi:acyl carrier protein